MSTLPKLRAKYGEGIGVEIFFAFPEIFDDQRTFLAADSSTGASSISANGVNFSIGQYIVIGQPGNIGTEIVQIHASTVPTATAITLATALLFPHNRGDVVRFIPYNQITPSRSVDSGANFTGLSAVPIRADSTETYLQRTADASTDVYKFVFTNSSTALSSASSDTTVASGYADNSIWSVKHRALDQLGEKVDSLITDSFLNDQIQEARRLLDFDPRVFRWSFREKFGANVGLLLAGQWSIAVPSDLRDPNTYKNILSLRIGGQNRPLNYQGMLKFNQNYLNVSHSATNGVVAFGASSIALTSTADFDAKGSATIASNSIGGLYTAISYTGNNKTTNTLTGVTGVPAAGFPTAADAWQRATFGLPTSYTISSGYLFFDVPLTTQWDAQNVKMDYYSKIPAITSDSQTFDEPFYDLYVSWLKWRIKYKKANGKIARDNDSDYKDFLDGSTRIIAQETPGQVINFIPDIEGFLSGQGS